MKPTARREFLGLDDAASWSAPHGDAKVSIYTPQGQARMEGRVEAARRAGVDLSNKNSVPAARPMGFDSCFAGRYV